MAALDDLLARISDPALRADIEAELAPLRGERELGLVFERHLPEKVRLHGLAVRRGASVELRADEQSPTWEVVKVVKGEAQLRRRDPSGAFITDTQPVADLVVVREFGQPIYPGLKSEGRIERGGDKPFHTVINSENFHALETLLYTCEGQVDVIYIDPPYNTGARDWKYNNDYVDGNDGYRHSKWLSFMEKRLQLAKRLLNPDNSALIVTIDEKEYLRLGMLLQQVFPGAPIQMLSITINPKGTARPNEFSRVDEFAFIVRIGSSVVPDIRTGDSETPVRWRYLRRTDEESARGTVKGGRAQFYPIYVNTKTQRIEHIGEALPHDADRESAPKRKDCVAVFPVREDGLEMNWGLTGPSLKRALDEGFVRVSPGYELQPFLFAYLTAPNIARLSRGELEVRGLRPDGSKNVVAPSGKTSRPITVWRETAHDAGAYGTSLLGALMPGRKFPFPKSLYAVEDIVRLFVKDKPGALVLDFFGGSGTTAHAVMRLNHQDGGQRRSIVITNNEIGPEAEATLSARGLGPGDDEWDSLGIFHYITKPRLTAAITGQTHEGNPVKGDYKFVDEFPMSDGLEENIEFFTLTYEDPDHIRLGAAFSAVAPLLWLMAGAAGPRIDRVEDGWALPDGGRYGVLFDADQWQGFAEAVKGADELTHAFIITDSDAVFQRVAAELPDTATPVRLYESYLRSFAINTGVSE